METTAKEYQAKGGIRKSGEAIPGMEMIAGVMPKCYESSALLQGNGGMLGEAQLGTREVILEGHLKWLF